MNDRKVRRAVTLIEFVVAIAVIAVLVGLLLVAVQAARLSAAKAEGMNVARQLMLATHSYAAQNKDQLLAFDGRPAWSGGSIIDSLCPYLEGQPQRPPAFLRLRSDLSAAPNPRVPPVAPAGGSFLIEPCSFAFNATCYAPDQRLNKSITDGLSNTIGVTEHYGVCGTSTFEMHIQYSCRVDYSGAQVKVTPRDYPDFRRTTFADFTMCNDVYPVPRAVDGNGSATAGSLPLTFQVRPTLDQCDPRIPQSSLPGGILAGMLDGSVRFLNPNVSQEVFWGSVTPAGGEVVTLD